MASESSTQTVRNLYLLSRWTNRRYVLNGDLEVNEKPADEALSRDFRDHIVLDQFELPPKVDLRPWMTKVEDQSTLKSW